MNRSVKIILAIVGIAVAIGVVVLLVQQNNSSDPQDAVKSAELAAGAKQIVDNATKCQRITEAPTTGGSIVGTSEGQFVVVSVPVTDKSNFNAADYKTRYDTEQTDREAKLVNAWSKSAFAANSPDKSGTAPSPLGTRMGLVGGLPTTKIQIGVTPGATTPKTHVLNLYFLAKASTTASRGGKIVAEHSYQGKRYCGTVQFSLNAQGLPTDPKTIPTETPQTLQTQQLN